MQSIRLWLAEQAAARGWREPVAAEERVRLLAAAVRVVVPAVRQ